MLRSSFSRRSVTFSPSWLKGAVALRRKGFLSNFLENVKKEANKDEELSKSVQKIEERLTDVKENAALKSIKDTLAKAKEDLSQSNEATFKELKEKAAKIQEQTVKAGQTLSNMVEPVRRMGHTLVENSPIDIEKLAKNKTVQKAAESIVKAQGTVIDENESYRYGGFMSKEKREFLRTQRNTSASEAISSTRHKVEENPE